MAFLHAPECQLGDSQVGVAISRGAFSTHIGLVFRDAQKNAKVLHLEWHKKVRTEDFPVPTPERCWIAVVPDIPATTAKSFVGVLRRVAKRQQHIPYGIGVLSAIGSFSPEGDYQAKKGRDGLTCATFVSELFRAVGVQMVQEAAWPEGVNVDWANAVCEMLVKSGVDADHVAAVRANASGLRIRPEELGAAGTAPYAQWPLTYEAATGGVDAVLGCLNMSCPNLPQGGLVH
jgi:hypothetical protein